MGRSLFLSVLLNAISVAGGILSISADWNARTGLFECHNVPGRWQLRGSAFGITIDVDSRHPEVYYTQGMTVRSISKDMPSIGAPTQSAKKFPVWTEASRWPEWPRVQDVEVKYWREDGFGWPLVWLTQSWSIADLQKEAIANDGFEIAISSSGKLKVVGIPTNIHWLRLLCNILVLFLGIWIPINVAARLRIRWREKHFLCVSCGYPRQTQNVSCPECGDVSA